MTKYYDELTASYLGHNKILKLLGRNYNLLNTRIYVKTYIMIYDVCFRAKIPHYKLFSLLQLLLIPDRAWESVLTNFIIKLLSLRDLG